MTKVFLFMNIKNQMPLFWYYYKAVLLELINKAVLLELIITATVTSYLENASRNTRDFAGIAGVVTPYEL